MTPLKMLREAVSVFEKLGCQYCLVGGHAASLYRSHERVTRDVDFALVADPPSEARKLAERALEMMNLEPMLGFIPGKSTEPGHGAIRLVTVQPGPNQGKGIIDILLPELPWLPQAVARAQHNRIDLGFDTVPVITPEDLILAKCYALGNSPDRFQDLDDLKEIFENVKDLDQEYLRHNLDKLRIVIPTMVEKFAPPGLRGTDGDP